MAQLSWILVGAVTLPVAASPCREHGGMVAFRNHEAICADGTTDKSAAHSRTAKAHKGPATQVLHMKSHTDRGQIVSPGEEPPPTTLANSK